MPSKIKNENIKTEVIVQEMPELQVAYVRHIGPYQGMEEVFEGMFNKLMSWAGPRGLIHPPETAFLCVYHDDPEITEEDNQRVSACITVPADTQAEGEIGRMAVAGGQFAVARFEINGDQYGEAWQMIMGKWLPESGYQPDDRFCYELYHNSPEEHPDGKHVFSICVPVKPL